MSLYTFVWPIYLYTTMYLFYVEVTLTNIIHEEFTHQQINFFILKNTLKFALKHT